MSDGKGSIDGVADTGIESIETKTSSTVIRPKLPNASQAAPLLMGVKLPIRVLLGRTQLPLRDVVQLGSGAVIELDCSPDDHVEIMVNGRVIAHGEVVVVTGNYGVRITKIASHRDEPELDNTASQLLSLSDQLR